MHTVQKCLEVVKEMSRRILEQRQTQRLELIVNLQDIIEDEAG